MPNNEKIYERLLLEIQRQANVLIEIEKRVDALEARPGEVLEEIERLWNSDPEASSQNKEIDKYISTKVSLSHAKELHTINRNGAFNADETSGNPGRPGCEHDNRGALPAISGEGREARDEGKEEITRRAGLPSAETGGKP